jgi:NTP pyrophosphatase (non-canonical NTP hydrolase)
MNVDCPIETERAALIEALTQLSAKIHLTAVSKGWWEKERNFRELIALMHSELSEALEGERHGNPPSEHIPAFSAVEEEFADTIIRILDTCYKRQYRLGEAILAKMEFNQGRAHKHVGKAF